MSDSNLEDGDRVQDYEQFHGKLSNKLYELEQVVPDNYYMTVEYCPFNADTERYRTKDRVSITINSDDSVTNQGECGLNRFHIILTERGGLEHVTRRSLVSDEDYLQEFDRKSDAWRFCIDDIERSV